MSASSALQKAILAALKADAGVSAIVGVQIYDKFPKSGVYPCITFGPSYYTTGRRDCQSPRTETFQIDVWDQSEHDRQLCKALMDAVTAALDASDLSLDDPYALERMDLVRAVVRDDPDGVTTHGILQFDCDVLG